MSKLKIAINAAKARSSGTNVISGLKHAALVDYIDWLEQFVRWHDTKRLVFIDTNILDNLYIATANFTLPTLYGPQALRIILPKGVTVRFGELGNNILYLPDSMTLPREIPIFVSQQILNLLKDSD